MRADPFFARCDYKPTSRQLAFHNGDGKFEAGRLSGKSTALIMDAAAWCQVSEFEALIWCPTTERARFHVQDAVRWLAPLGVAIGPLNGLLTFANGSRLRITGGDDARLLLGLQLDYIGVDDYSEVDREVCAVLRELVITQDTIWRYTL